MLRTDKAIPADRRIRQSGPSVRADFASSLMPKPPVKTNLSFIAKILHTQHSYLWFFLLLLGAACALISFLMDYVAGQFLLSRSKLMSAIGTYSVGAFFAWTIYSIALALIATLITKHVSPAAAGSGIPEMKARLSGIIVPEVLTWKTLLAKTFGLSIAIGSGLQVGKEGPTIHIAACVASCLMELNLFRKIRENAESVTHMLAAACAIGVASHFGAIIGGILFSIEVTAIYYDVRNFWKGIYGSSIAGTFFFLFKRLQANTDDDSALFVQIFPSNGWIVYELVLFAILGISCAIVSVAFIRLMIKYAEWRKAKVAAKWWIFASPYAGLVQVAFVTLVTCIFAYPGLISTAPYMRLSQAEMIKAVLVKNLKTEDWGSGAVLICNLFAWLLFKVLLTVFSITLPIPAGVFVPALAMGAVLGRAIGEISFLIFGVDITPSGYAIMPFPQCIFVTLWPDTPQWEPQPWQLPSPAQYHLESSCSRCAVSLLLPRSSNRAWFLTVCAGDGFHGANCARFGCRHICCRRWRQTLTLIV
jgi:chloride channel 2